MKQYLIEISEIEGSEIGLFRKDTEKSLVKTILPRRGLQEFITTLISINIDPAPILQSLKDKY